MPKINHEIHKFLFSDRVTIARNSSINHRIGHCLEMILLWKYHSTVNVSFRECIDEHSSSRIVDFGKCSACLRIRWSKLVGTFIWQFFTPRPINLYDDVFYDAPSVANYLYTTEKYIFQSSFSFGASICVENILNSKIKLEDCLREDSRSKVVTRSSMLFHWKEIGGKNASTLFDLQQRDVISRGVVIDSDWFSATNSFDFYSICVYFQLNLPIPGWMDGEFPLRVIVH